MFYGTFNLPNFIDHAPWYSAALPVGQFGKGNVPNITGTIEWLPPRNASSIPVGTGAFSMTNLGAVATGGTFASTGTKVNFNASSSNAVYSNVDRVVPAYTTCLYCIKY